MKTRIISGIVMVPLLIVLYFGGFALWAAALVIALMGIHEFCNGWNNIDVHPSRPVCYVMTVLLFSTWLIAGNQEMPQIYGTLRLMCLWMIIK